MEDLLPIILSLLFIVVPALLKGKKGGQRAPQPTQPKTTEDILRELLGDNYESSDDYPDYYSDDIPKSEYDREYDQEYESFPQSNTAQAEEVKVELEEKVPFSIEYAQQPKPEPVRVPVTPNVTLKATQPSEIEKSQISSPENEEGKKDKGKLEIDTKKMILYSEILKPKYME